MPLPFKYEFRDRQTGESLGSREFDSPDAVKEYVANQYPMRKVDHRPVPPLQGVNQKIAFGAIEGIAGPAELAAMGGAGLIGALRANATPGYRIPQKESIATSLMAGANATQGLRERLAGSMGIETPDPNRADLAMSLGRGIGGSIYGPRTLANAGANIAAEGADYAIQKGGGGMLARFAGSLITGVATEQLAGSSANRRATLGAVRGATNRRGLKAWNRLRTLDLVEDSFADALEISKTRVNRMLTFGQGAWQDFDVALKRGINAKGTEFLPGGIATADAAELYRAANYVNTTTAEEFRGELPKVITALVERSKASEKSGNSRMRLDELRSFHKQVNDLWVVASHKNASPLVELQAAKADELRGAIEGMYQDMLRPFNDPSVPNPQRGPTLGTTPDRHETIVSGWPVYRRNARPERGPGFDPTFPRQNPNPPRSGIIRVKGETVEQRFTPGKDVVVPPGVDSFPLRQGAGQSYMPSPLNREQAGALQTALESTRQLGSEIDGLKKAGFDLASGNPLEPVKMLNAILQPGTRVESPALAQDMLAIVTREDPVRGKAALSQSWMDYVFGPQGEFTQKEALRRLENSRAVGNMWADPQKVAALEGVIRSIGNKQARDHTFANLVGGGLGIMSGGVASGGDFPHGLVHGALIGGATIAGASAPRLFIYLKERYGAEAVTSLMREMVFDRSKYFKLKRIADGVPSAKDFEWVDIQLRAALLKAGGRAARQSQGEPQ